MTILTVAAVTSIACGTVLAVLADHVRTQVLIWRRVAGAIFVMGFVFLGLALSHWPDG